MSVSARVPLPRLPYAWIAVATLSIVVGIRYLATEPLIFEPGGWFALDGRRFLEAGEALRSGADPYDIPGFVYSPVALLFAAAMTFLPPAAALLGWIAASAVVAAASVRTELAGATRAHQALGIAAVLLFIPTIADLVLANVTIALVVACWFAIRGGSLRSGIVLGVLGAAFPKPFLLPLALWILVWRRPAAAGATIGGAVAVAASVILLGLEPWSAFVSTLRAGGGIELDFVGNYGLTSTMPALAIPAAVGSVTVVLILLARRQELWSLTACSAAGIFIAPYAGIYAMLPMLLSLPRLAAAAPRSTLLTCAIGIVTAPWAPIAGALTLGLALVHGMRRSGAEVGLEAPHRIPG